LKYHSPHILENFAKVRKQLIKPNKKSLPKLVHLYCIVIQNSIGITICKADHFILDCVYLHDNWQAYFISQ